jgi:hypothetical protein
MKQVAEAVKGVSHLFKHELMWCEKIEKPAVKINFSFKPKLNAAKTLEVNVDRLKEGCNLFETIMTQKKK